MLRVLSVVAALVVLQLHQTSILTSAVSIVAAAPPPPLHYSFASPGDVRFVRTLFGDSIFGFRDPSAPVFDGHHWHIWATRINGTAAGYGGVVWHLYSEVLDAPWRDGGIAVERSSGTAWDSCGVFTPSVAWEGAGGAAVPAPQATAWFLFFGGVSHPQGPVFDESIGIATASSPFGPWTKLGANPIITGRDPNVPWCDVDGPGAHPGILHVDEAEPYVLHGERRLYVKTVCRNHTVLPSVFIPRNGSSWMPPYDYDALIHQPVIAASTVTPSAKGFEQARLFLGPDQRLHLTAMAYDGFNPHFISTDGNVGNDWELAERIPNWGAGIHELTPVGPAGVGPDNWLGPPGVSGVVEYFIQFAERPYRIDLLKVKWEWRNSSGPPPAPPPPSISYTVIGRSGVPADRA